MVGTSRISTEPDSTLFSVALSGYGYPAEGRFSINWIFHGNIPVNIAAITGLDGKFFAADSNRTLWSGTPSAENILWKKIGAADDIKAKADNWFKQQAAAAERAANRQPRMQRPGTF